jgi:hypothetical protein
LKNQVYSDYHSRYTSNPRNSQAYIQDNFIMDLIVLAPECSFRARVGARAHACENNREAFSAFVKDKAILLNKSEAEIIENFIPVDMMYPRLKIDDRNVVLRFCASRLSIPKEAFSVAPLFGFFSNFNKDTGLECGFSYKILKEHDKCFEMRKIEYDIIMERHGHQADPNCSDHLVSYKNFIQYYNDEAFPLPKEVNNMNNREYDLFSNLIAGNTLSNWLHTSVPNKEFPDISECTSYDEMLSNPSTCNDLFLKLSKYYRNNTP